MSWQSTDRSTARAAGERACQAAKRTMQSSMREVSASPELLRYEIRGPGGLDRQMQVSLRIAAEDDGSRRVSLSVEDFLTTRPLMLGIIPAGPRQAPAMKSLQRFAARLQKDLL